MLLSMDFETHLIGPGAIVPKPVCMTWASSGEPARLVASGDGPMWRGDASVLTDVVSGAATGRYEVVGANISGFDWPVVHEHFSELRAVVWEALERGAVHDVQVREKLLNLCTIGQVDHYYTPDGKQRDISYALAVLAARYLGKDRMKEKGTGNASEDIWRLHFDTLDGVPSSGYPPEAASYAKHDAEDALGVYLAQERRAEDLRARGAIGHDGKSFDPFLTESLHVAAKFALALMSLRGFRVDPDEVERLRVAAETALAPERTGLLVQAGILLPPQPARSYRNGSSKMVSAKPARISRKALVALVEKVARENEMPVQYTAPSATFPGGQVSTDGEVIGDLMAFDPVLEEYDRYSGLQKLVTLEIPRLEEAVAGGGTIHPTFEELKRTGRTSSRKSKLFPSVNIQQISRGFEVGGGGKIEPRHAYVPRDGFVLCSVDYSTLELVTAAQKAYSVTGRSVLREKINAGMDPHAWLGAQIAFACEPDFADYARTGNRDEVYRLFESFASSGEPEEKKFYKKYRMLAKPTGLGYPGGLGAKTFVSYAKATYGVQIRGGIEEAKKLKIIWMDAFPEFNDYFEWIEHECREDREDKDRFGYFSPLGMYRANCTYTACANGAALQTPAGEGAKIAVFHVTRACYDSAMRSVLQGCFPLAFVHDEMLVEIPEDGQMHARAMEITRIMVESMREVCPDVVVKAEPALMRRWDKAAEPVYGEDGLLRVWEPGAT